MDIKSLLKRFHSLFVLLFAFLLPSVAFADELQSAAQLDL